MASSSSAKAPQGFSTEQLREFYFSKATNYNAYKRKVDQSPDRSQRSATPSQQADAPPPKTKQAPSPVPSAATPSGPQTTSASPVPTLGASQSAAAPATKVSARGAAGSAVRAVQADRSQSTAVGFSSDSVSPDYIAFLRQQQDLVKVHCKIDEILAALAAAASERRQEHVDSAAGGAELLRAAESSTGWNWRSKYSKDALVRDAGLVVPDEELRAAEDIPNIVDLQHQHQQLVKLRQDHCGPDTNPAYRLALENGVRRFERLIKEFSASQLDATPVVRLSDNLLVQLDHLLGVAPLPVTLQAVNSSLAVLSSKQKACAELRDQAHDDGEMGVAERETYRLVDLSEELASTQVEKIRLLKHSLEEIIVGVAVRDAYVQKAADETAALEAKTLDLRTRCETDLGRLYQLKKSVDDTEALMAERWTKECAASEGRLTDIGAKQGEIWAQMEALAKQLRQLEVERHAEVKRRIDEKVKDETRRIEHAAFTAVADSHAATLDRTMRNCDTNIHCTKLMAEFLQSGFYTIQKDLAEKRAEVEAALLDAQKTHLSVFRSLLFTLSDLEYKKERRVEEVGENIQAAHIQQELCNDSLNPAAKKYSDAKKELLRLRDELELEVRDIRERMGAAVEQYRPSDAALVEASVSHRHPLEEMEERRLSLRAKMVEYRAMSLGTVTSEPIKRELGNLRKSLDESRRVITNSTSRSAVRAIQ